ncbi:hypothetical protein [Pseudomonas rhodesiae]|jgi:hypothetical protein|uniref:hypothetical protein n=1 Tax=Pseudomonas rhodesiae TaxID=76760 RepID=UPI00209D12B1|nr:hypothetical protein [Pseudomonas rhodesiae]MCP1515643.1 hypothetical protein [Pseudomonas rhodesiae]MDF9772889.1 hypothetical protein [Pseudomonas rhodesiae]
MSKMKVLAGLLSALTMGGCASTSRVPPNQFEVDGVKYGFEVKDRSTLRLVNQAPLKFAEDTSMTDQVLLSAGLPTLKQVPLGRLSANEIDNSTRKEGFDNANTVASLAMDVSSGLTNASTAGALGAVNFLLAPTDNDPRTLNSAYCFVPSAVYPDQKAAYKKCIGDIKADLQAATQSTGTQTSSGGAQISIDDARCKLGPTHCFTVAVNTGNAVAALGYAPVNKGGYKAYIFRVSLDFYRSKNAAPEAEANMAKALSTSRLSKSTTYRLYDRGNKTVLAVY